MRQRLALSLTVGNGNHVVILQRNLKDVSLSDLIAVAKQIRTPTTTTLRLFVSADDQRFGNVFRQFSQVESCNHSGVQ